MMRRLPIVATLLVLAAVAVMVRLGFWQLDRADQKAALLARYAAARTASADVPFPQSAAAAMPVLYRHARVACRSIAGVNVIAGRSAADESGMAHVADCLLAGGGKARVVLGWSRDLSPVPWPGGVVSGTIAPGPRLVADPPLAGLAANARPDPADIPNNHLSYAVQWFLFALTALVIYAIALGKRLRET
jgi:cytochrome oxidase assembly protein ShyY1